MPHRVTVIEEPRRRTFVEKQEHHLTSIFYVLLWLTASANWRTRAQDSEPILSKGPEPRFRRDRCCRPSLHRLNSRWERRCQPTLRCQRRGSISVSHQRRAVVRSSQGHTWAERGPQWVPTTLKISGAPSESRLMGASRADHSGRPQSDPNPNPV